MTRRFVGLLVAVLIGSVSLFACQEEQKSITVKLSFAPLAENAFLFLAIDRGYFEPYHVNVEPSNGSSEVVQALGAGKVDFGFISGDVLVKARLQGTPIRAIATLYHDSPVSLYSLKEANIQQVSDLKGKKVGVLKASATYLQYRMMLDDAGVDPKSIVEVPSADPDSVLTKVVDVAMHYTMYAPVDLEIKRGIQVNEILAKDNGVNVVSSSLATSEKLLGGDPKLVRLFLSASLRGLMDARNDPDAAVESYCKRVKMQDPKAVRASLDRVNEFIFDSEAQIRGPGYIDLEEWRQTQSSLYKYKDSIPSLGLKSEIDPRHFVDGSFIEEVWAELTGRN